MKYTAFLAALAALLIANQSSNAQGTLTPPGAPAESQKSLQEIYDAIESLRTNLTEVIQIPLPFVTNMVAVYGGNLPLNSHFAAQEVATFYIGKYEVTWEDWQDVAIWAAGRDYSDLHIVGSSTALDHPVPVNWYDALKWCNALSEKEGLNPVYYVNGEIYKNGEANPSVNETANGYRLPTEAEWEWAARGGIYSKGYIYAGSNDLNLVGWYDQNNNIENTPKPVGSKFPNELGIYDMSGNLVEWCWDILDPDIKIPRGGAHGSPEGHCQVAFRGSINASNRGPMTFRLARNY